MVAKKQFHITMTNKIKPGTLLRVKFPDELFEEDDLPTSAFWSYENTDMYGEGFCVETFVLENGPPTTFTRGEIEIPCGTRGLLFLRKKRVEHYPKDEIFLEILHGEKTCWVRSDDVTSIERI